MVLFGDWRQDRFDWLPTEGQMRAIFFVPVILVIVLAAISLTVRSSLAQGAADECIAKPGSAAPQGSHWYFRVNRSDHRHCWYVGPEGAKVRAAVRQAQSPMHAKSPMHPGPISPVAAERPAKAPPAEIKASNSDVAMDFAMRWPDLPRSYGPSLASASYAE